MEIFACHWIEISLIMGQRDSTIVFIFLFIFFFPRRSEGFATPLVQSSLARKAARSRMLECARCDITWRVTPAWRGAGHRAFHGNVNHDSPRISNWKGHQERDSLKGREKPIGAFYILALCYVYIFFQDVVAFTSIKEKKNMNRERRKRK